MRMGGERVREAKAQTRRREWEDLWFRSDESIEDFTLRLTAIVNDLELLGDPVTEYKAVLKFLRVVPRRYRMMTMAIEQTVDLRSLTIEDVCGRLLTAEEGYDLDDATDGVGSKLLLTEEEWSARQQQRRQGSASGSKGNSKPKPHGSDKDKADGKAAGSDGNTAPRRPGNYRYCGKADHWAKECRKAQRDHERKGEAANLAEVQVDPPALLLAALADDDGPAAAVDQAPVQNAVVAAPAVPQTVFLNEERVVPVPAAAGVWYLDTCANSHMTGTRDSFVTLDESIKGSVRFGDGSLVTIAGKGNVLFRCSDGNQRILADVFFIPKLCTNIISLEQLDENGCKSVIEGGFLCVFDQQRRLLVRVKRAANRLYSLNLNITAPVCLLAKVDDPTWLWHARLGHLHFRAMNAMSKRGMVRGMPQLDHIDEICDGCTIGKQHRLVFPSATNYRSERALDLMHMDLCGPIKPATGGGNQYFLLVVDDYSRYM
jgi:hypothetical protein